MDDISYKRIEEMIVYEDNHLLIVSKPVGEITQGDKTNDIPLVEKIKSYIKVRNEKPGAVFLGLVNRIDRPTSGLVIFAKTSKALTRMNAQIQSRGVKKYYLALVQGKPKESKATLVDYLRKNEKQNKSYAVSQMASGAKEARLTYQVVAVGEHFSLLHIELFTGRHHQIRCQLSKIGCPIRGDLKYGAKRSNRDGGISLHSFSLSFVHPVSREQLHIVAPPPEDFFPKGFSHPSLTNLTFEQV